jgi:hypothetical protein
VNLSLRDVYQNLGRFLLTCIGVSLLLGVVMGMIAIYRGLVDEALGLARAMKADVWVVEGDTRGPFAEASRMPGDTREGVASLWGVEAAGSVLFQNIEIAHRGATRRLMLIGWEPGRPGGPPVLTQGRPITRSHYEAIADRRAGFALGEQVTMGRNMFTIVGLIENLVASGGDPVIFTTLRDAQRLQFELEPNAARREQARNAAALQNVGLHQRGSRASETGHEFRYICSGRAAMETSLGAVAGAAGERSRDIGHRTRKAADRAFHVDPAHRFDGDHWPHHLHDDHRQEATHRDPETHRRA